MKNALVVCLGIVLLSEKVTLLQVSRAARAGSRLGRPAVGTAGGKPRRLRSVAQCGGEIGPGEVLVQCTD